MSNLKVHNEALLLKYLDKFYNMADTPWVHLLWQAHYRNKVPHDVGSCGSFWWKDVCKLSPIFLGITTCKIIPGNSFLFWKDPWGNNMASDMFPGAFSFAINEYVSDSDFLSDNFLLLTLHCLCPHKHFKRLDRRKLPLLTLP